MSVYSPAVAGTN